MSETADLRGIRPGQWQAEHCEDLPCASSPSAGRAGGTAPRLAVPSAMVVHLDTYGNQPFA